MFVWMNCSKLKTYSTCDRGSWDSSEVWGFPLWLIVVDMWTCPSLHQVPKNIWFPGLQICKPLSAICFGSVAAVFGKCLNHHTGNGNPNKCGDILPTWHPGSPPWPCTITIWRVRNNTVQESVSFDKNVWYTFTYWNIEQNHYKTSSAACERVNN